MYVIYVYLNESITKHGLTPNSTSHQSSPLVHPLHQRSFVFILSSGSTYTFESKYHSQSYTKPSIISSESICTSESRRPNLSPSPLIQPTTHLSINNAQKLGPNLSLSALIQVMHPSL